MKRETKRPGHVAQSEMARPAPTPSPVRESPAAFEGHAAGKPSALVDTRVIYCGDNLEQLKKLPDACVDLIYIDPPFNTLSGIPAACGWRRTGGLFQ